MSLEFTVFTAPESGALHSATSKQNFVQAKTKKSDYIILFIKVKCSSWKASDMKQLVTTLRPTNSLRTLQLGCRGGGGRRARGYPIVPRWFLFVTAAGNIRSAPDPASANLPP